MDPRLASEIPVRVIETGLFFGAAGCAAERKFVLLWSAHWHGAILSDYSFRHSPALANMSRR
jgi:hypothetical protein